MRKHKKTETAAHQAPGKSMSVQQPAAASASAHPEHNGKSPSEEVVRLRAYQKWEAAGRPSGEGVRFWVEAEQELAQAH